MFVPIWQRRIQVFVVQHCKYYISEHIWIIRIQFGANVTDDSSLQHPQTHLNRVTEAGPTHFRMSVWTNAPQTCWMHTVMWWNREGTEPHTEWKWTRETEKERWRWQEEECCAAQAHILSPHFHFGFFLHRRFCIESNCDLHPSSQDGGELNRYHGLVDLILMFQIRYTVVGCFS